MRARNCSVTVVVLALAAMGLVGCATPGDWAKAVVGVSTTPIEDARPGALAKVFDSGYKACYEKTEAVLKAMPNVTIYAKTGGMIAVYWKRVNTTPVGVFFTQVDASHTKVEVASPSTTGKEWVAQNVFAGEALAEAPLQKFD